MRDYKSLLVRLTIGIIIGLLVAVFVQDFIIDFGLFEKLRLATIDRRFNRRGPLVKDGTGLEVVIVSITKESFKNSPAPYPFPRHYYTRAIQNLNKLGAKVIGIDLIFDTPSYQHPHYDRELRETISRAHNVVLSGIIRGVERRGRIEAEIIRAEEDFSNIFFSADSSLGFVQMRKDSDGVIRRYPIAMLTHGGTKLLPSFATAILNRYDKNPPLKEPEIGPYTYTIGERIVPRSAETVFINYYGNSGTFTQFDIIDIIDDETLDTLDEIEYGVDLNIFYDFFENNPFKDKIILIGPMYPESQDLHPTPVYPLGRADFNEMYGVEIHANMIQSLLDNNSLSLTRKKTSVALTIVAALFFFMITSAIKSIKLKKQYVLEIAAIFFTFFGVFLLFYIGDWYFINKNLITPITSPAIAILLGYFGSAIYQYIIERKQKEIVKSIFSHYVSPAIVNELINDPKKLQLGGQKRELTVMFSDIAGFTTISERLPPEELVEILNEYLDAMTDIIIKNEGTLDKYEGDAIMAFWGAPMALEEHAYCACKAALKMQNALAQMRNQKIDDITSQLYMRIGINTGEMIVGNMGGKERFDYTVIGDSVNLSARLESANKQYGTSVIISEYTYNHVKAMVFVRELDLIVVKGRTKPTKIYELIGLTEDDISSDICEKVVLYDEAIELYWNRQWQDAIAHFQNLLKRFPNDRPSMLYVERATLYDKAPPPADWNGAFIMESK